jgi:hypothetical protein
LSERDLGEGRVRVGVQAASQGLRRTMRIPLPWISHDIFMGRVKLDGATFGAVMVLALLGCGHPAAPKTVATNVKKVKLAVLPAESDVFPKAAKAASDALVLAKVKGIDETQVSKASLEVVQLSIECVDPTIVCYEAAGQSLTANRLLFAQITPSGASNHLNVAITLFDVDASTAVKTAEKEFASDDEASVGVASLVTEATQP